MKIGISFCLQWVCVTVAGFLVNLYWIEIDTKPNVSALECIIGGSAIALLQGLILQQRLAIAPQWLLVSFASWVLIKASIGAIGWVAPETLQLRLRLIHGCLQGAVVGLLLGVGQWFILRQQVKKASMWILANAASWAIALGIGWTVGGVLRHATHLFLSEVVSLTVTWLINSAITGVAMVLLLGEIKTQDVNKAKSGI